MKAAQVIRETEAILARCAPEELEHYSFEVWRKLQQDAQDAQAVQDAMPCQVLGREEIDPDTWRA